MNGGFLLDTNIPSELMRSRPEPKVEAWLAEQDITALFLSVVSSGELESGFVTITDSERRTRLEASLDRPFDASVSGASSSRNAGDRRAVGQA